MRNLQLKQRSLRICYGMMICLMSSCWSIQKMNENDEGGTGRNVGSYIEHYQNELGLLYYEAPLTKKGEKKLLKKLKKSEEGVSLYRCAQLYAHRIQDDDLLKIGHAQGREVTILSNARPAMYMKNIHNIHKCIKYYELAINTGYNTVLITEQVRKWKKILSREEKKLNKIITSQRFF